MIKLLITNSKGTFDISQMVQTVNWSGDDQQCSRTLEIELISSYTDKNLPTVICELGNEVVFKQDNRILFSGFVFERQKDTESSIINITCYDRGIYLKRNESTYKFTNITPEAIAKRICTDFDISVGSLAATNVPIERNFIGTSLFSIIQTAYFLATEESGKKYLIRFNGTKLEVIERKVTDETMIIAGGINLMSASTSESISNMVNQVAIYNSDDKLVRTEKDDEAIKSYGLMQSYLMQPDDEDATQQAKQLLTDNGISQKITINNLGNIANIAGAAVVIHEPYTGLFGLFFIESDIHTWKNGQYYNKLTVSYEKIMEKQEAVKLPNKDGKLTRKPLHRSTAKGMEV